MARTIWIGTGWKMNHLLGDAEHYATTLKAFIENNPMPFYAFILPPFTSLNLVNKILSNTSILVGAQNMHWEDQGAFTGEISPLMVNDCGARLVEIGHSERRAYFNETDQTVNRKVIAALRHSLTPLVCIGETAEEKNYGVAQQVLGRQVRIALNAVPMDQVYDVVFAYEPVWAIGTGGVAAEADYVSKIHSGIRKQIAEYAGEATSQQVSILYGGSVNQSNMLAYLEKPDVDGLFIGRAAWKAEQFIQILKTVKKFLQNSKR